MQSYYRSSPQRSISTYFQLVFYTSSRPKGHVRCLWAKAVVTAMVLILNWRETIRLLIITHWQDVSTRRSLSTAYRYQRNATIGLYNISFVPDEDLRGWNVARCSYLLRESLSTQLSSTTSLTVMFVNMYTVSRGWNQSNWAIVQQCAHKHIHTYTRTHKFRVV